MNSLHRLTQDALYTQIKLILHYWSRFERLVSAFRDRQGYPPLPVLPSRLNFFRGIRRALPSNFPLVVGLTPQASNRVPLTVPCYNNLDSRFLLFLSSVRKHTCGHHTFEPVI